MYLKSLAFVVLMGWVATIAQAADDPTIPKAEKALIQRSMAAHIKDLSDGRGFPVFEAESRKLIRLKLKKLHTGVFKKGDLFASCADFTDSRGNVYDIDFLVQKDGSRYEIVSSLVHSKNGKKSAYDIGH